MAPSGLRAVRLVVPLLCFAAPVRAQLIPIKTLPIAQGDQFQLFPANNLGMGSVSIALADSLNDPFVNPATGTRVAGARFFSSPTVYNVSRKAGGGRSLPLAVLVRSPVWFGGLSLALQQVDPSRPPGPDQFFRVATPNDVPGVAVHPPPPTPPPHAPGTT